MKSVCSNCFQEVELPDDAAGSAVSCPACGAQFTAEPSKPCRHCGALNPKSATRCVKCGKSVIGISIRKPGTAPAPAAPVQETPAPAEEAPKPVRTKITIRKPGAAPAPAAPAEEVPAPVPAAAASAGEPAPDSTQTATAMRLPKLNLTMPKTAGTATSMNVPKLNLTMPKTATSMSVPKLNLTATRTSGTATSLAIPKITPQAQANPETPPASAASAAPPVQAENAPEGEEKAPRKKNKTLRIIIAACLVVFILGAVGVDLYMVFGDPTDQHEQLDEALKSVEEGNMKRAARLFRKSAKQGNLYAAAQLGELYRTGNGVEEDLGKAIEMFTQAKGVPLAEFRLGQCYAEGKGVSKDLNEAVKHYETASKGGYPEAVLELARFYAEGIGVKKDERKALPWCRKLAEGGDLQSQLKMAKYCLNGVYTNYNPAEAVKYLKKAADQGSHSAQYQLAECTLRGIGMKPNEKKAKNDFKKLYQDITTALEGAKTSDDDLIVTAKCLINGYGVKEPDPAQAAAVLAGPVKNQNPEAVMLLYLLTQDEAQKKALLEKGLALGIPEAREITALQIAKTDPKKAENLLKEAQDQGSLSAYTASAAFHMEKNPKQAFKDSKFASERKDPLGSMLLAKCYETGRGTPKDPIKALEIYWSLTDPGSPVRVQATQKVMELFKKKEYQAELLKRFKERLEKGTDEEKKNIRKQMAYFYLTGTGVKKDTAKAVDLLWEAQAYDELSQLLEKGIESKKIAELFLKAEKISDPQIRYALAKLLISGGKGIAANPAKGLELLKKAADAGHPQAAYEMGCLLAQETSIDLLENDKVRPGMTVAKSFDGAMKYFQKAAAGGHPAGQYRYARALLHAKKAPAGVQNKEAEAELWLAKSVQGNYVPAFFLYPMVHLESGNTAEAELPAILQSIRTAADAGYVHALFAMGDIASAAGKEEEANAWYEKAAEKQYVPALLQLKRAKKNSALIHEAGEKKYLPAQAEEALILFKKERKEKSAKSDGRKKLEQLRDHDYPAGLNELAVVMYDKDKKEAKELFQKAENNGSACAMFNLAVFTYREENLGRGNYRHVQTILKKLRDYHPDFTKIPENLEERLDRQMALEAEFRGINARLKDANKALRFKPTPEKKQAADKLTKDAMRVRSDLDDVTSSLKKDLDWMLESDYAWFFRKASPKIRYIWIPAADLSLLKEVYK